VIDRGQMHCANRECKRTEGAAMRSESLRRMEKR
jgi:hypothetical protein